MRAGTSGRVGRLTAAFSFRIDADGDAANLVDVGGWKPAEAADFRRPERVA